MVLNQQELKDFLDVKVNQYNNTAFIENDPIAIPHQYSVKEDIEISGFLVAIISWGNRKTIVKNGLQMMQLLGNSPYDFILNHKEKHLQKLEAFVHRTFNGTDLITTIKGLKSLYKTDWGIESVFMNYATENSLQPAIHHFKEKLFEKQSISRTFKHVSDPLRGSAAKRINMYLRWMVRKDNKGVDFGIWKNISPATLSCPLDVHSGSVARKLGLLTRIQTDAKAVEELDKNLRLLDKFDPVKYDFALFGLGIFEKF